jgi:hypothetical protein
VALRRPVPIVSEAVCPQSKLQQAIERVPDSVRILGPLADTVLSIENEGREPRLLTEGLNWERYVTADDRIVYNFRSCKTDGHI